MFFQQLSEIAPNLDLTLRLMRKGDSITISVLPASTEAIQPLTVTGSAADLDESFMDLIRRPMELVSGLQSNVAEVEADVNKKLDKAGKAKKPEAKAEAKPAESKPAISDLAKPEEPAALATQPELAPVSPAEPTTPAAVATPQPPAAPKPAPPRPAPLPA